MAEKRNKKIQMTFIVVGLIASIFSFVYYYALKCPNDVVFTIICVIDMALFLANSYWIALTYDKIKKGRALCAVMFMLIYFGLWELLGFVFVLSAGGTYTIELIKNIFFISLFLSPSIIIVLPIFGLIMEYM